jgi:hypothetical protein
MWSMRGSTVLLAAALTMTSAIAAAQYAQPGKAQQNFVRAAAMTCIAVQMNKASPVRCWLEYVDNKPTLLLSFEGVDKARRYAPMVLSLVGPQLCTAALAERNSASLALIDRHSNRASQYSCHQRMFTDWVRLKRGDREA